MRRLLGCAIIFLATLGVCHAADTGKDILRRSLDLSSAIKDYSADVVVVMDLPTLAVPRRTAKVYYKRPNKVAIKSRGIVMIPKRALMPGNLGTAITQDTQVSLVGKSTIAGQPLYALKVVDPKDPRSGRLLVWVRGDRYTVERMEVYEGPKKQMSVEWTYQCIGGKYWMPQGIKAHLYNVPAKQGERSDGTVTVSFSNVTVNTGLSDSLFREKGK